MTAHFEIREYEPNDKEQVVELWSVVFPGGSKWNEAEKVIARKSAVQPHLFSVALEKGTVIGTIMAGYDGVRGWVHRLAVHPDFRRLGIATHLMHAAEEGLRRMDCPKLNLQVRASNLEVVKFYESLGYDVENRASLGKALS